MKGRNMTTYEAYEDKFCKNSQQMGVAVLGDSISAHFHIPEEWLGIKNNELTELYFTINFCMITKMLHK